MDKGYYSLDNYELGISGYNVIPVIAPKYENTIQKLNDVLSYPLDIFKNKDLQKSKHEYDILKKLLLLKLEGWDDLKPVRGLIEDFFKVGKDLF